jgi:hypothetical protein
MKQKNLLTLLLMLFSIPVFSQCPNPTTTGGQICEPGGVVNLSASGSSNIRWYDQAAGGNLINLGNSFPANVITSTTYYVEHDTSYPSAATTVPMPAHSSVFTGNVRGYYFTAPTNFTMTSVQVPVEAGGGLQSIAVVKFNGNVPPPLYATVTNAFTVLFLTQNNPNAGAITVDIPVMAGEVIGLLGCRGTGNSYAPANYVTTINGMNANLARLGMQFQLPSTAPQDLWTEAGGSISRVNFDYTIPIPCTSSPRVPVTATVLPSPTFSSFTSTNITCNGAADGQIVAASADPGAMFAINPAATQLPPGTFSITTPDIYTVTLTDGNSCTATSSATITEPAPLVVTANASPSTTCMNTAVLPSGSGALTYVWTGGLSDNVPFIATASDIYTVTGTDGSGCTATSSVSVTVNAASGNLAATTSSQSQQQDDDFNLNYYDGGCNLIASINDGSGGNILGITSATVNVDAIAGTHNGQPYVRRWYQITPASNGSADVVLYIDQSDFNDYNAVVVAPYLPMPTAGNNADPNIANIRITKNDDAGLGNNPMEITPTVNWNGTYWELSFNTPSFSQFRIHGANPGGIPLPASILSFSGHKMLNADALSWTTATENNCAYFTIQHSTDGVNFKDIEKVNSKSVNGNSNERLSYSALNTQPAAGHNYYRLIQTDMDNQSRQHAHIVDLNRDANGGSVSIYPNPAQEMLNIDLYSTQAQHTLIQLLDMSGRMIKQVATTSVAGMNHFTINLKDISSGLYTLQIYANEKLMQTTKVKKND